MRHGWRSALEAPPMKGANSRYRSPGERPILVDRSVEILTLFQQVAADKTKPSISCRDLGWNAPWHGKCNMFLVDCRKSWGVGLYQLNATKEKVAE
jgi:hypothetical protein